MAKRRTALVLTLATLGAAFAFTGGACVLPEYDSDLEALETGDASVPCETECNGNCSTLGSDPANCGACGVGCESDEACVEGQCTPCGTLANCGYKCSDLDTDPDNCSECGNSCAIGPCVDGSCVGTPPGPCPGSQSLCGETCSDVTTDQANCGECGNACIGTCIDGGCVTNIEVCKPGNSACGESCFDLETDPNNCGECGNACIGTCQAGSCITGVTSCPTGLAFCDGNCTDVSNDSNNCGECGNDCNGWTCVNGGCEK